jgi:hypothetical protein
MGGDMGEDREGLQMKGSLRSDVAMAMKMQMKMQMQMNIGLVIGQSVGDG